MSKSALKSLRELYPNLDKAFIEEIGRTSQPSYSPSPITLSRRRVPKIKSRSVETRLKIAAKLAAIQFEPRDF